MPAEKSKRPNSSLSGEHGPLMFRRQVRPELAGEVFDIVGYRELGNALRGAIEMAPLVVPLIISFSDPFEIALGRAPTAEDRHGSFASGLFPGYVMINSSGASECVQIDFTPLGARRFFGLPMREIASRMVSLDDLGDRAITGLRARLGEERDWDVRLDLVKDFVAERLGRAEAPSAEIAWAYDAILRKRGAIRIGDVARSLDWSRKHLNQRFGEEIGLGPKAVARMVRFNRVLALTRTAPRAGWADIAADCGYSDQAHLVREFREFSGMTPGALPIAAA